VPEQRRDLVVQDRVSTRPPSDDGGIVVEHARCGDAAEALQRAHKRGAEIAHGLGEREHGLVRGRVRQRRHEPVGFAIPVLADRDGDRQVPPVELADLAGCVGGALKAASREITRPLFLEIVLEDRYPTRVATRLQVIEHHGRRDLGVFVEHLRDVWLEGIQKRALWSSLVARWLFKLQEAVDGVARHRELAGDRGLGPTLTLVEPVDLGPVMH
jgi:hypothetical protein